MATKYGSLAAMAAWAAASGVGIPRLSRTPKPEKYPGQRRAYLMGASSAEGEKYRAWKAQQESRP